MKKTFFTVAAFGLSTAPAWAGGGGPFTDGATLLAHTVGRLIGRLVGLDW